MPNPMLFAGAIRGLRARRDLSQRAAAQGAGVQLNRMRDFERGRAMPWLEEWVDLWAFLSTGERPPECLLDEETP